MSRIRPYSLLLTLVFTSTGAYAQLLAPSQAIGISTAEPSVRYQAPVSLGSLSPSVALNASNGSGINNAGIIVGNSTGPVQPCPQSTCSTTQSFFWEKNQLQAVAGADTPDFNGFLKDINDKNESVGFSIADFSQNAYAKPFMYKNGTIIKLPHFSTASPGSVPYSINTAGKIIGVSNNAGSELAVLWANGTIKSLGTLPSDNTSRGLGINDLDVGVGSSSNGTTTRAVRWSPNGDIASLHAPHMLQSQANAINNKNTVVGKASFNGSPFTAVPVLWRDDGSYIQLNGNLAGEALGINSENRVVGTSTGSSGNQTAFLWDNGKFYDLNSLIPANTGWVLIRATAINDKGEITGTGNYNGHTRAFVISPAATR